MPEACSSSVHGLYSAVNATDVSSPSAMVVSNSFFTFVSPQKYTQHLLSGTPAFHDHAQVGVRSHAGATSNQSSMVAAHTVPPSCTACGLSEDVDCSACRAGW